MLYIRPLVGYIAGVRSMNCVIRDRNLIGRRLSTMSECAYKGVTRLHSSSASTVPGDITQKTDMLSKPRVQEIQTNTKLNCIVPG